MNCRLPYRAPAVRKIRVLPGATRKSSTSWHQACAGVRGASSVLWHPGIDFIGPRVNTAFDALHVLESLFTQELQRLQ